YTARSTQHRMLQVTHSHAVLAKTHETLALLRNAESEQRGYLITGGRGYGDAAEDYAKQLDVALDELSAMVADNPIQTERTQNLRELISSRLPELRGAAQGNRRTSRPQLRLLLGAESEVRLMPDIRRIHAEMTA